MRKIGVKSAVGLVLMMLVAIIIIWDVSSKNAQISSPQNSQAVSANLSSASDDHNKRLVYIVSDIEIPFWAIMGRGVQNSAESLGYTLQIWSSQNSTKRELELTAKALQEKVSGIILSPTTSSACATILRLANGAGVPVVISDIGTDGGEYVSYISSDNKSGAYAIGKILAKKMEKLNWKEGRVGIVAIPQKRLNGQTRTAGFMKAMEESGIRGADLKQQVDFSYEETYRFTMELIRENPDIRAVWLQGSNRYQAALDAIEKSGKKGKIILLTFDAEPEFLELIPKESLAGAAMQQPFLMGEEALKTMDRHLKGEAVEKNVQLPVLAISSENIAQELPSIRRNVLGMVQEVRHEKSGQ